MPGGGAVLDVRGSRTVSAGKFVDLLSESFSTWINRRVDNVYFESDRSIRREILLHVDLSAFSRLQVESAGMMSSKNVPVPLLHLSRSARCTFSVNRADGSRVPFANISLERQLVANALAEKYVEGESMELAAERICELIAPLPPLPIAYVSPVVGKVLEAVVAAPNDDDKERSRKNALSALAIDADQISDASDDIAKWQESYLLVALLPADVLTQGATVLTITYVESVASTLDRWWLRLFKRARRLLGGTISWGARLPIDDHRAESQHINVYAPADYMIVDAPLKVTLTDGTYRWISPDARLPTGAHIFWKQEDDHCEAVLGVKIFAPRSNGILPESFLFSVAVALTLFVFTIALANRERQWDDFDPNFAAATLLLIPAVVISILTYRESSRVAAHASALARFTLVVQAMAMAACAAPFAFEMDAVAAEHAWYCAYFVALAACGRQIFCCALHWMQMTKTFSNIVAARMRVQTHEQSKRSRELRGQS
jgi:hypothetical protein